MLRHIVTCCLERLCMGILINNKYYADKSAADVKRRAPAISNQNDVYRRTQEYQKYDRELIQPYTADGKPNPEFIKHYPEESKDYGFIKERQ